MPKHIFVHNVNHNKVAFKKGDSASHLDEKELAVLKKNGLVEQIGSDKIQSPVEVFEEPVKMVEPQAPLPKLEKKKSKKGE